MKKCIKIVTIPLLLLSVVMTSCSKYDRTEVERVLYVNHQSLKMFVGEEIEVKPNPQDGSAYVWQSDNEQVATVSNGLVSGVGEGSATITVRKGDLYADIPVSVLTKVETTGISLSSEIVVLAPKTSAIVVASTIPSDANDIAATDFKWWSQDESVAIVNYVGEIKAIGVGETKVYYRRGDFVKEVSVFVDNTTPFKGPHLIKRDVPLVLYLLDFDLGGKNNAYYDLSDGDDFNTTYRSDNGDPNPHDVDIEGGNCIGRTYSGEWLMYTVQVEDAGVYNLQVSCAGNPGGRMYCEIDGVAAPEFEVQGNGNWTDWQWFPSAGSEITLSKGRHKVRVIFSSPNYNSQNMRFSFVRE